MNLRCSCFSLSERLVLQVCMVLSVCTLPCSQQYHHCVHGPWWTGAQHRSASVLCPQPYVRGQPYCSPVNCVPSREVLSCARFPALLALHWILQAHHSEDRDAWILPSSSAPGPAHPCALGTDKNSLLISEPSSSSQTALLHTQVSAPQGAPRRYTAEKDLWVARAKLQKSSGWCRPPHATPI